LGEPGDAPRASDDGSPVAGPVSVAAAWRILIGYALLAVQDPAQLLGDRLVEDIRVDLAQHLVEGRIRFS
jgi:hypothetical protein